MQKKICQQNRNRPEHPLKTKHPQKSMIVIASFQQISFANVFNINGLNIVFAPLH
jgi:hypothetical protein